LDEKYLSDIDDVDKLSKNMIRMIEDSSYWKENLELLSRKKDLFSYNTIASEWGDLFGTWSSEYHTHPISQKS
jgi:hypothetical protein